MQTSTISLGSNTLTVKYPDYVVFAFNPLYYELEFSQDGVKSVRVSVWNYNESEDLEINSIDVDIYHRKARIYISRMLQLVFYDPFNKRSVPVAIRIEVPGHDDMIGYQHLAIWGRIDLGQRLNAYGVFAYDRDEPYCYRVRKWFKNFPFKVSTLATNAVEGLSMYTRFDGNQYGDTPTTIAEGMTDIDVATLFPTARHRATMKMPGVVQSRGTSVFDDSFDYTFFSSSEYAVITDLVISDETDGHYLRWIDNFGQLQYYLFVKGKQTTKNKLGTNEIIDISMRNGMWFPDLSRKTAIESTTSLKCCAVKMSERIWDYVATIINSPLVDLYLGKSKTGEEIWCPVNIAAANHDYKPTDVLHDLEISFTMPTYNSQML